MGAGFVVRSWPDAFRSGCFGCSVVVVRAMEDAVGARMRGERVGCGEVEAAVERFAGVEEVEGVFRDDFLTDDCALGVAAVAAGSLVGVDFALLCGAG